ncbi:hypothetical protein LIER_35806 [Lithospermum erythrorhizon]|uniref:Uncharacterized protein n=1 Tax=Lithospermum erythrorhizon TaxID=34254 RepID=A0AAV3NWR1_LITER
MRCSLTEEEARPVVLEEEEDLAEGVIDALKLGFLSIQGFYLTMSRAWNYKDIRVSRVSGPILHIFFPTVRGLKEEYHTRDVAVKMQGSLVGCEAIEMRKDKGGKKFFQY